MKGLLISLSILAAVVVAMVVFKRDPQTAAGGGIDSSASAPIKEAASAAPVVKRNPVYQIISMDTNEFKNAVYLEILIQDKITMEDMIAIAHNERRAYGGDTRLHAGF